MTEPLERRKDEQSPALASDDAREGRRVPVPRAATASALDPIDVRRDFVEVGTDLSRLVEALGPDILFEVPKAFRGERNVLPVRSLISARAAMLPGFVAELARADPLRHPAFRVEGRREREFVGALRAIVREVLLEPRAAKLMPEDAAEASAAN